MATVPRFGTPAGVDKANRRGAAGAPLIPQQERSGTDNRPSRSFVHADDRDTRPGPLPDRRPDPEPGRPRPRGRPRAARVPEPLPFRPPGRGGARRGAGGISPPAPARAGRVRAGRPRHGRHRSRDRRRLRVARGVRARVPARLRRLGDPTLRTMLDRLVYSKEIWTAALAGRDQPERGGTSIDELRERHERSGEEFARAVRDIRNRNAWDTAFVDALCDPPETFTFGGMVAHVLTWSAHRRQVIVGALRNLGADVGTGDPIEWERRAA